MKKMLFLLFVLFLSGCSATYNLEIKNSKFNEKIEIDASKESELNYFKNNDLYSIMSNYNNFHKYNKKIENSLKAHLSYNYNFDEYKNATVLNSCFNAYSIIKEKDYYILSTSTGLKCVKEENSVLLNNLKIVIKTNHKVIKSNADKIDKYTYIWNIDQKNYDTKEIYLKFYQDKYVFNYNNEFTIKMLILSSIVVVLLLVIFIIIKKVKKAGRV